MAKKKSIIVFLLNYTRDVHLAKDPASYVYYLSKVCDWQTFFAYFSEKKFYNVEFEKFVNLVYLGRENEFSRQQEVIKDYIKTHSDEFDIIMLMNYGSATYKIANYAKSVNKKIKIYSKLDMGESGFSHFYDGSLLRRLKNIIEVYKTRNIDLFSIENRNMYAVFKDMYIFKNKIMYIPNCVSMLNVDSGLLCDDYEKDNIILTVGRLGDWYKNNELFLDAVDCLSDDVFKDWKVYLIGSYTKELSEYLADIISKRPLLKNRIIFLGEVNDRTELYRFYAKAKIFVLSSRSESFGIATVEAMYFGAYPVLTNFGSIAEDIVDDGRYGCVVDNYDKLKLSDGIYKAIKILKEENISRKIIRYARKRFSYEYWTQELSKKLL